MTFNSLICHRSYPCLPSPDPLPLEPASVAQGLAYSRVMTVQRQNWQGQVPSRETLSVRRELWVGCFVFQARRDLSVEAGRVCHRLVSVIGTVCNSRSVLRRTAGLWAMTGALGVEGEMVRCGVSRPYYLDVGCCGACIGHAPSSRSPRHPTTSAPRSVVCHICQAHSFKVCVLLMFDRLCLR